VRAAANPTNPMNSTPDNLDSDRTERSARGRRAWSVVIERGVIGGRIPRKLITNVLMKVGQDEKAHGELRVIVVDNRRMRQLNRRFRDKNRATDVLAFPAGPVFPSPGGRGLLGEVYCNIDHAREWTRAHGGSPSAELARLAVHGCLHLLGFRHRTSRERRTMMSRENRYLANAGLIALRVPGGDDHVG